jgi:hypothetical protein
MFLQSGILNNFVLPNKKFIMVQEKKKQSVQGSNDKIREARHRASK